MNNPIEKGTTRKLQPLVTKLPTIAHKWQKIISG